MPSTNNDKFLIVKSIKKFILDLDALLINFPRKDFVNKDGLYKEAIALLENVYLANNAFDKNKKLEYQVVVLSKINILDFYIERAYKMKYISEKQCLKKMYDLDLISKMVFGWIKNEK